MISLNKEMISIFQKIKMLFENDSFDQINDIELNDYFEIPYTKLPFEEFKKQFYDDPKSILNYKTYSYECKKEMTLLEFFEFYGKMDHYHFLKNEIEKMGNEDYQFIFSPRNLESVIV